MPAPLLWLGAGAVALLAGAKYSNDKTLEESVATEPGTSDKKVIPVNGAIVTCGIYEFFEHTGIWVDGNIIELKGNGLIRGISPNRFLHDRSGEVIYVACDANSNPLVAAGAVERAVSRLYSYSEYDVIKNNCHNFAWYCVSGENVSLTRFSELNQSIAERFNTAIHWHPVNL